MIQKWFKAVFWGSTAKSFWTFGSIISAVFALTPYASHYPLLRVLVPLGLFIIGFFVSSCVEYIALARKLHEATTALTVRAVHTNAGEVMELGAKHHTVVADIYLNVRNQSADGNSIRLHTCSLNIAAASLNYLQFFDEVGDNTYIRPNDVYRVNPKSESKPVAKAVFTLPESPYPTPETEVHGYLEIIDIHEVKHNIEYSAILAKNPPIVT